jgi:hypothetical protein
MGGFFSFTYSNKRGHSLGDLSVQWFPTKDCEGIHRDRRPVTKSIEGVANKNLPTGTFPNQ